MKFDNFNWRKIILLLIIVFLIVSLAYFAATGNVHAFLATWKLV